MTVRISAVLPRGRRDFARQLVIWFGFGAAYQVARGLARGDRLTALGHASELYRFERRLGAAFELALQRRVLDAGSFIVDLANWTYWLSQFVVVGLVLLWIYLRRYGAYLRVRDTLIVTNALGLVGYVVFAVAPPRLLPGGGFVDTLATASELNHGTPIVRLLSNPYAALPSLHAADAVIVAGAVALLARSVAVRALAVVWPAWVVFALILTGNHFWLDIALGVAVAAAGALVAGRLQRLRAATPPEARGASAVSS